MEKFYQEFELGICDLKFSPDSDYFAATGEDFRFIIYSLKDDRIVFQLREERVFPNLNWGKIGKHPFLVLFNSLKIRKFSLDENNYPEFKEQFSMISTSTKRYYLSSCFDSSQQFLFAGTTGGEVSLFSLKKDSLELNQQVCSSPITIMKNLPNGNILCFCRERVIELKQGSKEFQVVRKVEVP